MKKILFIILAYICFCSASVADVSYTGIDNLSGTEYVFRPTELSNCVLWLDAQDEASMVKSGTDISQWNDKSTSNNHFTGINSPQYLASGINTYPSIDFTTTSSRYFQRNATVLNSNADFSYFVVFQRVTGFDQNLFNQYVTSTEINFSIPVYSTNKMRIFNSPPGGTQVESPYLMSTGIGYIGSVISDYDGTTSVQIDDNTEGSGALSAFTGTAVTTTYIGVRRNPNTVRRFTGYMGEVIIYSRAITSTEKTRIKNYLKAKWGIS